MSIEVVKAVKAELEKRGKDLSGPCGAFAITRQVAIELGLGVLSKPSGNNCESCAVDQVMTREGAIRDILGDAGGANTPTWGDAEQVDPARYVAVSGASVLGAPPKPQDAPTAPTSPSVDLDPTQARIAALEAAYAAQDASLTEAFTLLGTHLQTIEARLKALEAPKTVNTSRTWGHAHTVEVK